MQSWFRNSSLSKTARRSKKNCRFKPALRSKFDALSFAVEELEHRVLLAVDVTVAKTAPANGTVGTEVTDTATLTNGSGAAVSSVSFSDVLGNTNVTNVSASDAAGDTFAYDSGTNTLSGTITSLATGDTAITILYTPTAAGTFGDTASVNITGTPTSATASTTVSAPDVSVAKTAPADGTVGTASNRSQPGEQ